MSARAIGIFLFLSQTAVGSGRAASEKTPSAYLVDAPSTVEFPALTDSNSPAFWDYRDGTLQIFVFNSWAGKPWISSGPGIEQLGLSRQIAYTSSLVGGSWMEAVVQDGDGTLYGYYHNEVPGLCEGTDKVVPRIGAARSTDQGLTWSDLGILLEAPPESYDCESRNRFFAGGVGDLSVLLGPDQRDLYIFFSSYPHDPAEQGVAAARMAWADRDAPGGKVAVWHQGIWEDPSPGRLDLTPIYSVERSWHDPEGKADALWGPAVHFNTFLNQYVMLLNRAGDSDFTQEGIYVAFSPSLEDPTKWSSPWKLMSGGVWYPQVMGSEPGTGTDKLAGQTARFFLGGRSRYIIFFTQ